VNHRQAALANAARIGPSYPFNRYSDYLRTRFGGTVYRVAVDAGFTCPVRDSGMPCTYCDLAGSRAPYLGEVNGVEEQIAAGLSFLKRRYRADRFLLYFQAFSNTYAPVADLRRIYDHALSCGDFEGLIVSTRPDCIDSERAELLAQYRARDLDVWVEMGLQTANDETLVRIRRGHTSAQFAEAVEICKRFQLNTAAHLILGLPGEGAEDAVRSSEFVSRLGIDAVKFHNLVVVEGTKLYEQFLDGRATAPDAEAYLDLLIAALEHLPPEIIVMRLTCDAPRNVTALPEGRPQKNAFVRRLAADMKSRATWQGRMLDTDAGSAVPYRR